MRWLKTHNRHYKDIHINETVLQQLEQNPVLPFHIEHVVPSIHAQEVTSHSDNLAADNPNEPDTVVFDNVVMSDVNGSTSSNDLHAAAFHHVITKGKGYIQVARDFNPVNEFDNPFMLPMCFPTLFPYGIVGSDDPDKLNPISLKRYTKHLFSCTDSHFQLHYSFLFIVFNILQRREMLLQTSLKTRKEKFPTVAAQFAELSPDAIHAVTKRVSRGDFATAHKKKRRY